MSYVAGDFSKEATENLELADYMGKVMAHAFVNEVTNNDSSTTNPVKKTYNQASTGRMEAGRGALTGGGLSLMSKGAGVYESLGVKVGKLVDQKNAAYGDSFNKCGRFLKLLYPNGIQPHEYEDMLCIVRVFDKMMRIATNKGAFDESPFQDIAGYALLGLKKDADLIKGHDLRKSAS